MKEIKYIKLSLFGYLAEDIKKEAKESNVSFSSIFWNRIKDNLNNELTIKDLEFEKRKKKSISISTENAEIYQSFIRRAFYEGYEEGLISLFANILLGRRVK